MNNNILLLLICIYFVMQICNSQKRESFSNDSAELKTCQKCVDDTISCEQYRDFLRDKNIEYSNNLNELDDEVNEMEQKLKEIFDYCEKPKFMAHNGSVFDHRILFKSLNSEQLLDSRYIIRLLYHQDTLKLNLSETYKLVTGKEVINCHRAKDDVKMMIEILKKINYSEIY